MANKSAVEIRHELLESCQLKLDRFRDEGLADVEAAEVAGVDDKTLEQLGKKLEGALRTRQWMLNHLSFSRDFETIVLYERVIDDHRVFPPYLMTARSVIEGMDICRMSDLTADHLLHLGSVEFLLVKATEYRQDTILDEAHKPFSDTVMNCLRAAYMFGSDSNRRYIDDDIIRAATVLRDRNVRGLQEVTGLLDALEGVTAPLSSGVI